MRRLMLWMMAAGVAAACQGGAEREVVAARALAEARQLEYDVDRIQEAIDRYRTAGEAHAPAPSAKRAGERAAELSAIAPTVGAVITSQADSVGEACLRLLALAPNYPPLMDRMSRVYYNTTRLWSRAVPAMGDLVPPEHVLAVWHAQDSLFSAYPFGADPKDREMADLLCRQSVDLARMLEDLRRYDEALVVITRGMAYGKSPEALMRARVFGSFYSYRTGKAHDAIAWAREAVASGVLTDNLKARAHHVMGLSHYALFEDTADVSQLDASIKALNEAVTIDSTMSDARDMLHALRAHRERLSNPAS